MPWRVRYEKYQTVLGPTGLERSDIFHNELFSAYNQYLATLVPKHEDLMYNVAGLLLLGNTLKAPLPNAFF